MLVDEKKPWAQVERILESDTFHASGVLRRLFKFLAEKAFSGEADQLKEYSIGIDAFGKPPTYDPRQDAIVRLQIGRLRQKLGEYYRTEGKDDPVIMELPKGRFKLSWESRTATTDVPVYQGPDTPARAATLGWRRAAIVLAGVLIVFIGWSAYATALLWNGRQDQGQSTVWTPELEQLWKPFVLTKRPLIVAIADPLFVALQGTDVFIRKKSLNRVEDATGSLEIAVLRKALGNPNIQATFNFTPRGELMSSFLLGRLLGSRRQDISLARTSQVSLEEEAENNVLYIGPEVILGQRLSGIGTEPQFVQVPAGIQNLHPQPGEPSLFADVLPGFAPDNGEVYSLISHLPGPLGNTDIESFTSSRTWGRQGAVQALTDPVLARSMVGKLRRPSGEIPRYYQVIVRVKFTDGLPTEVSYVLHRDLTPH